MIDNRTPAAGGMVDNRAASQPSWLDKVKSYGKSAILGAAQGAAGGWADEIAAANVSPVKDLMAGKIPSIESYRDTRDLFRSKFNEAKQANPKTFMGGEFAGGAATAPLVGEATIPAMIGMGAAQGLGNSEADLTKGDYGKAAMDTAVGGALGGGIGLAGKALSAPAMQKFAQERGAKALGYTKRFLNSPEKISRSKEVAQTMLDEGVITPLANAEDMAGRVSGLADRSGAGIGSYLKSVGTGFDPNAAIAEIESIRPSYHGGDYDVVHNALDRAIETIKAHGNGPLSFEEANKLKGLLQEAGKFGSNSDAVNIGTRRMVAGKFRSNVDQQLEDMANNPNVLQTSPITPVGNMPVAGGVYQAKTPTQANEEFQGFLKNKKIYGASQDAEKTLNNRLSSEQGNNALGLTDILAAGSELAAGSPVKALGLVGLKRGAERYGNQTMAYGANKIANVSSAVTSKLAEILKADPQLLGEYLDKLRGMVQVGGSQAANSGGLSTR